jgi:hypothetical protein
MSTDFSIMPMSPSMKNCSVVLQDKETDKNNEANRQIFHCEGAKDSTQHFIILLQMLAIFVLTLAVSNVRYAMKFC